jgi:hypothetical protein
MSKIPDDWEFLVDVARDVLEWLLEHEPSLGLSVIDLWERSKSQVLQRLAIHGWGRRADVAPEAHRALTRYTDSV